MSAQLTRGYLITASAIVIAGVLISATLFLAVAQPPKTSTSTATNTRTETSTLVGTVTATTTSTQTTTLLSTVVATLVSTTTSVRTQTTVSQVNYTTTDTVTQTRTSTVASTTLPWYGLVYLSADPGCATEYGQATYPVPCFSYSDPYVFDCAAAAATAQGCSQRIYVTGSPNQSFNVTVWYPFANQAGEQPWQNCKWTEPLPSPPGPEGPYYAYCIKVNSTSFLVAEPAPPPV